LSDPEGALVDGPRSHGNVVRRGYRRDGNWCRLSFTEDAIDPTIACAYDEVVREIAKRCYVESATAAVWEYGRSQTSKYVQLDIGLLVPIRIQLHAALLHDHATEMLDWVEAFASVVGPHLIAP
jgi:hypothetical protein